MSQEIKGKLHNHDTAIHIQYEDNGEVINHTCIANANANGAIAEAELFAKEIVRRWNAFEQQPTAGEFTKKVRLSVQSRKSIIAKITDIKILALLGWIPQLCDRLDRAEAQLKAKDELLFAYESVNAPINPLLAINKDLLKVCGDILLALEKIKKTQKIDPFYLDTLIAVLKKQLEFRPPFEGETDNPDIFPDNEYPSQSKAVGE